MKRIIILGDTGYIGSNLKRRFESDFSGSEIVGRSVVSLDLTNLEQVVALAPLLDLDTALVVCSGIKKQYGDSLDMFCRNMSMVTNLSRVLHDHPVGRLIYFSSAEVYGEGLTNTHITESTPVQPTSYYGIAKYASEGILQKLFQQTPDSSLVVLRPVLVYGPGEGATFYGPGGFLRSALNRQPITMWGDGEELRAFLFIDDLTQAVSSLLKNPFRGTLNVAPKESSTFRQVVEVIGELLGAQISVQSRPRTKPKADQAYDNGAITDVLPELQFTSVREGIRRMLEAKR